MEPFIYQKTNIPIFLLESWSDEFPHLTVGFSARFSEEEDWNRSNYAFHVGERPDHVIRIRKKLTAQLNMPFEAWTSGEQVHDTNIELVGKQDRGKGRLNQEEAFPDTDGLLTFDADILLTSFYADCVPLLFYSPDRDIIGVAHAGWKGTVHGIAQKMIERIIRLGAAPENIRVAIGPSISSCCYQVDERVMDPLKQILVDPEIQQLIFRPGKGQNQYHLDLKEANKQILLQVGVSAKHITQSGWCTSCYPKYFHSHRRDKGNTGRMVAWIGKKLED